MYSTSVIEKLKWSLPWLIRYPFWRLGERISRVAEAGSPRHLIFLVANHFEPVLGPEGMTQLEAWYKLAVATGNAVRDHDGTPFRHTNFFPAEQYEPHRLSMMASLQAEGYGEVEVHFHHGIDQPDTAENTRRVLENFRDTLAEEHKCLSRESPESSPKYGFVHGNWALANSAGGRFCGVDSEMEILAETGCYADFTLPSAPDRSQVPRLNAIYQCGNPLIEARPHRSGPGVRVGQVPKLPIIFTGPLVFDWHRRLRGLPVPRIDDGALAQNYPLTLGRFNHWRNAHISIVGRPEWTFIKLYAHGFFEWDQDAMIGDQMKRFMTEVLELSEKTREFKVHFVSAREAFNIAMAAVDGHGGEPGEYRDYRLRPIMNERQNMGQRSQQESPVMV